MLRRRFSRPYARPGPVLASTKGGTPLRKGYSVNVKPHHAIAGIKWSKALHIFVQYAFHLESELNMWVNFRAKALNEDPFAFLCVFCFHTCCLQAEMYRFSQVTL